jgi:hypothetical protein
MTGMAYGIIYEFTSDVGRSEYDAVNGELGIDGADRDSDWPTGLVSHAAGSTPEGAFFVYEVWESKSAQEAFMTSRLGGALAGVGIPAPVRISEIDLVNHQEFSK